MSKLLAERAASQIGEGSGNEVALPSAPRQRRRAYRHIVSSTGIWIVACVFLIPYAWMIVLALKPENLIFADPPRVLSGLYTLGNFGQAWDYAPFGRFLANSLFTAGCGMAATVVVGCLGGYGFARLQFGGREVLFRLLVATLLVPETVFIIPLIVEMKWLSWVDSYEALIVPFAFGGLGSFLLRQGFLGIPRELEEASTLDGAGRFRQFWQVMLPQVLPQVSVLAAFSFVFYWNNFFWPLVIIQSESKATVPLGLQLFLGQNGSAWNLLMAATLLMVLPSALIVALTFKIIVRGFSGAGITGE